MKPTNLFAFRSTFIAAAILTMGLSASAAPVNGSIGFSGTGLFTFTLAAGSSFIDFQNPVAGGFGDMVAGGRDGFFATVPQFDPGTIKDMSTVFSPPYAHVPVNTSVSIDDYITFNSLLATTNIRLTKLLLADCSSGGTCVGPFQLLQSGANVSVSANIIGQIFNNRTAVTPDISNFTGIITAQFVNTNVQAVIAAASSPSGLNAISYSGTIAATGIPEPGTTTLLGIGLFAMLAGGLRAKQKSRS